MAMKVFWTLRALSSGGDEGVDHFEDGALIGGG